MILKTTVRSNGITVPCFYATHADAKRIKGEDKKADYSRAAR